MFRANSAMFCAFIGAALRRFRALLLGQTGSFAARAGRASDAGPIHVPQMLIAVPASPRALRIRSISSSSSMAGVSYGLAAIPMSRH